MQTLYCPRCETKFGQPIEMEEEESRFSYSIYRCPRCLHMRKVTPHLFSMNEIEDVSKYDLIKSENEGKSSSILKTAVKVAGVGLAGLAGLAVLGALASDKSDSGDSET